MYICVFLFLCVSACLFVFVCVCFFVCVCLFVCLFVCVTLFIFEFVIFKCMSLQALSLCYVHFTVLPIFLHIDPRSRHVTVNESSFFRLFCNASGNPEPNISWKKTGDASLLFPDGNWLTVQSATPQHNGTYQCIATNEAGSVHATFDVLVYCEYCPIVMDSQVSRSQ